MATANEQNASSISAAPAHQVYDEIPKEMLGLRVIPTSSPDPEVDIVAVHGLGAIPNLTWKASEAELDWLEDRQMLPAMMRTARIMRFGYDSLWFGKKPINTSLDSIADRLLSSLEYKREDCPNRPIIFLGHCFGGLVIQRALVAENTRNSASSLLSSCIGSVFLGTPHRGTTVFDTQGFLLEVIAAASENSSNIRYHDSILSSLRQTQNGLSNTTVDYVALTSGRSIKSVCFFEEREADLSKLTRNLGLPPLDSRLVALVPESSARLDNSPCFGLGSNHFTLNKFSDPDDGDYLEVALQIRKLYRNHTQPTGNRSGSGTPAAAPASPYSGAGGSHAPSHVTISGLTASGGSIQNVLNSGNVTVNGQRYSG